jgi:hypothetical protein
VRSGNKLSDPAMSVPSWQALGLIFAASHGERSRTTGFVLDIPALPRHHIAIHQRMPI